jgi:hypothetical protein
MGCGGADAAVTGLDIDVEHAFETLCPSHSCMAWCVGVGFGGGGAPGWSYLLPPMPRKPKKWQRDHV